MVVLMSADEPDKIVTARIGNAGGVVIGLGEGENFIATDMPAILEHTRRVIFLESRQMAIVTAGEVRVETLEGAAVQPEIHTIAWDPVAAEKGEYRHFMQKEIHEQARAVTDTLAGRVDFPGGRIRLPELNLTPELARKLQKIYITACGTAAYAGMVGKYLIEKIARIPVEVVDRLRVPLQRPDHRRTHRGAGHHPVRRDRRHAGRHGGRPAQGRRALEHRERHRLAGHAPGGWLHLDANRTRDRRGLHQGFHRPAGRPVHAGHAAGRPARHARREHPPGAGRGPAAGPRPGRPDAGPRS